jgi:YfiH family protein
MEGDAAITALTGKLLGVQTADCVPVLIAESQARAVAAIHAGWRGTAARIAELTVERLTTKFHVRAEELTAVIGPSVGVCCYEVGEDVVKTIADDEVFEQRVEWLKPHLNLAEANRRQLRNAGIPGNRILVSSLCTQCRGDLFFSYRREGRKVGRLLSVIGIAP